MYTDTIFSGIWEIGSSFHPKTLRPKYRLVSYTGVLEVDDQMAPGDRRGSSVIRKIYKKMQVFKLQWLLSPVILGVNLGMKDNKL